MEIIGPTFREQLILELIRHNPMDRSGHFESQHARAAEVVVGAADAIIERMGDAGRPSIADQCERRGVSRENLRLIREECAKICDEVASASILTVGGARDAEIANRIAARIRAMP